MGFQKSSARKENGITEHGGKQDKFEGKGKEKKGPTEIESNFLITSGLTMNWQEPDINVVSMQTATYLNYANSTT